MRQVEQLQSSWKAEALARDVLERAATTLRMENLQLEEALTLAARDFEAAGLTVADVGGALPAVEEGGGGGGGSAKRGKRGGGAGAGRVVVVPRAGGAAAALGSPQRGEEEGYLSAESDDA